MSDKNFKHRIHQTWATALELPIDIFQQEGTHISRIDKLKGTGAVHLYHIGEHTIIRCDSEIADKLSDTVDDIYAHKGHQSAIHGIHLNEVFTDESLHLDHIEKLHYLNPEHFKPFSTTDYPVQYLSATDQAAVEILKSACTVYEYEDSWVSAEDECATGAFDGEKLIACASMYQWMGFADPGVLIHPDYRGKGLGKATISALCEWALKQGRLIDYRCTTDNMVSAKLAESLGFQQYYHLEAYQYTSD